MRTYLLLLLSFTVAFSLPVQGRVPEESVEEHQRERNPLLADLLPPHGHVVQEDPKPIAKIESFVKNKPAEPNPVQQNEVTKGKSLSEKKEAQTNEAVRENNFRKEPQEKQLIQKVENIPEIAVDDLTEKPVMELEHVSLKQKAVEDKVEKSEVEKQEKNILKEEELTEAGEQLMELGSIAEMQEDQQRNLNELLEVPVVEEKSKIFDKEEEEEGKNNVLKEETEEQQEVHQRNPSEFVEDSEMNLEPTLVEEQRNAMQALMEAEEPMMEPEDYRAEMPTLLEETQMEPYEYSFDPVLESEPSQEELLTQDLLQMEETPMMEPLTGEKELTLADKSYMEESLMNQNLIPEKGALVEIHPAETEPSNNRWRTCNGVVIDGKCYQFFRGPKKAPDAEFFCQDHFPNGHLASVSNSYIHRHMELLMEQNGGRTRTWIGGLRYLDTGRFIWLDGTRWGYADWLPGEPNNTSGVEECVELLSNGKFNDMPCWDLRAFICSYPF